MSLTKLAIIAAVAWFSYRLVRSPRDLALRAVVACLVFRYFAAPSTIVELRQLTGGALTPSLGKLVLNIALNASWLFLLLFFLFAAAGGARRAWRQAAVMIAVSLLMALALFMTPDADRAFPSRGSLPTTIDATGVAVFYLAGAAYIAYSTSEAARWALRYAAESSRRTRLGLRLAAMGLAANACLAAIRAGIVIVRWLGGTVPAGFTDVIDDLVPTALLVFVAGACWAGLAARIAAFRVWTRRRRIYHQLYPLWVRLHDVFPEGALEHRPRSQWFDWLSPRRVHRRYWRRVIEIRDGLLQLSPHLADLGFEPEQPAHEQAGALQEALGRQRDGVPPSSPSAVLIAAPDRPDQDADVEQLVALAHALSSQKATS